MKSHFVHYGIRGLLLVLLLSLTSALSARDKDHFSLTLGVLQHEDPNYDPALNLGLAIGGSLLRSTYATLGLQLAITTSVVEGKTRVRKDWEMDSHALYTTLHLGRTHYIKLKAGYIDWQVRYDLGEPREGSGLSWGVGYGYPMKSGNSIELDYTVMSDEEGFGINYISLGYYF